MRIIFGMMFFSALLGCEKANNNRQSISNPQDSEFIKMDFEDDQYKEVLTSYAKDTITPLGWKIEYFVKKDASKYSDLYVHCKKGEQGGFYKAEHVLEYRRYFTPKFVKETTDNIYFLHGCATDCAAILVYAKSKNKFTDYEKVVDYNLDYEQILSVPYEENFCLLLNDLKRNRQHKLTFKEICIAANPLSCVDTVVFGKQTTIIKTALLNPENPERIKNVIREINL